MNKEKSLQELIATGHYKPRDLEEHLKILEGVKLHESLDYETIGKMVVASLIRATEKQMLSQPPDEKGHIRLDATLRHSFCRVVTSATTPSTICCVCEVDDRTGIIICRGACCPEC